MRNVFVADSRIDGSIRATPEPTPAVVRIRIFREDHKVNRVGFTEARAGNAKDKLALLFSHAEIVRLLATAPLPAFPFAEEAGDLSGSYLSRQEKVALERQENGRSFAVLRKGENRRADLAPGSKRNLNSERILAWRRETIAEDECALRSRHRDRDIVRSGKRLFAVGRFRHSSLDKK